MPAYQHPVPHHPGREVLDGHAASVATPEGEPGHGHAVGLRHDVLELSLRMADGLGRDELRHVLAHELLRAVSGEALDHVAHEREATLPVHLPDHIG